MKYYIQATDLCHGRVVTRFCNSLKGVDKTMKEFTGYVVKVYKEDKHGNITEIGRR